MVQRKIAANQISKGNGNKQNSYLQVNKQQQQHTHTT